MEECIEILSLSNDGDALDPRDLSLVEAVVNFGKDALTQKGQERWNSLLRDLRGGGYRRPWLYGIEHLTQDHQGYVYWKGVSVEHYSHRDAEAGRRDASQLAQVCQFIERQGKTVSGSEIMRVNDQLFWGTGLGLTYEKVIVFHAVDAGRARISVQTYRTAEEVKDLIHTNLRSLSEQWSVSLNAVCYTRVALEDHWQLLQNNLMSSWKWAETALRISPYDVDPSCLTRHDSMATIENARSRVALPKRIEIRGTGFEAIF